MLAEMNARTKAALLELKPHDREILVLRYLEQLGVEEIAAVLGISQTAVTSRHLRALQRLRRLLGIKWRG
jgi:RNA polymerase sigma-70 factor (ECF subfamily)